MKWASKTVRHKAKPITPEQWNLLGDVIRREYHKNGSKHARQYMAEHHQFFPTEAQWKKGLYKVLNVKNTQKQPLRERSSTPRSIKENKSALSLDIPRGHGGGASFRIYDDAFDAYEPCIVPSTSLIPATIDSPSSLAPLPTALVWQGSLHGSGYTQDDQYLASSKASASPNTCDSSALSSTQRASSKRTASVSSQSSVQLPKRTKTIETSRLTFVVNLEDESSHWATPASRTRPAALKIDSDLYNESSPSQRQLTAQVPHQSGKLKMSPITAREEIVFPWSSQTRAATTYVRVRTVNPNINADDIADYGHIMSIAAVSEQALLKLNIAAKMLTACGAAPVAFNIHHQIYLRLGASTSRPDSKSLMSAQALACARVAQASSELDLCVDMLNEQLGQQQKASRALQLRMALGDILIKDGDDKVGKTHRAVACGLLGTIEAFVNARQEMTLPDWVSDLALIRAFAYKTGRLYRTRMKSRCSTVENEEEEEKRMAEATNKAATMIWRRLARGQEDCVRAILMWCQRQLLLAQQYHINFLRGHMVSDSLSPSATKRLHVAALFGYFSMRKQEEVSPQDAIEGVLDKLDAMTSTSLADVLWTLSTIIVETMEPTSITLNLTNAHFGAAHDATTKLSGMDWENLSDVILPVIHVELSCTKVSSKHRRSTTRGLPWLDQATKLVLAVIRRDLGIFVQVVPPSATEISRPSELALFSNGEQSRSEETSNISHSAMPEFDNGSKTKSSSKPAATSEPFASDYLMTGQSNHSSTWLSMERIRKQTKQFLSWNRRTQKTPAKFVRESYISDFGNTEAVNAVSEGFETTAPPEDNKNEHRSVRSKLGSTMRSLKEVPGVVGHFLGRK